MYAVISPNCRPHGLVIFKSYSEEKTVVCQPLTVDDASTGRFFVERSNRYLLTGPPSAFGEYASPMRADVIGVGPLYSVRTRAFKMRKRDHHDNGKPPFHPAVKCLLLGHAAKDLTRQTLGVAALSFAQRTITQVLFARRHRDWRADGPSPYVPAIGPLAASREPRQLRDASTRIPFVRAFSNRVKTLVLNGTPMSVNSWPSSCRRDGSRGRLSGSSTC